MFRFTPKTTHSCFGTSGKEKRTYEFAYYDYNDYVNPYKHLNICICHVITSHSVCHGHTRLVLFVWFFSLLLVFLFDLAKKGIWPNVHSFVFPQLCPQLLRYRTKDCNAFSFKLAWDVDYVGKQLDILLIWKTRTKTRIYLTLVWSNYFD